MKKKPIKNSTSRKKTVCIFRGVPIIDSNDKEYPYMVYDNTLCFLPLGLQPHITLHKTFKNAMEYINDNIL